MSEPSTSNTSLPWWHWRRISLPYKRRARRRMKAAAERALDALDKTLQIAGEAAGDTGVPGLAGALAAVRIVLQKIQAMKTNVEGVDSLAANVASLRTIIEEFFQHREGQQISKDTLDQIAELETTWSEIAQKASDIKSRGRVRRFFASNTDAKRLEGFVQEISTSIHEKFMLRSILNTKEDVHVVRQNVEVLREDVRTVQEDVELVADGIEEVYGDVQMVRRDVEMVHEDIGVVHGDVRAVREDTEVVREDIGMVLEDVETVREDVEVVLEGMGALSADVQVVQEDVTAVREDVQVAVEDIGAIREDMKVVSEDVSVLREDVGVVREDVGAVREDIQEVRQDVKVIVEGSFMTTYAKNAQYDAGRAARRSCLEGTRVGVLNHLYNWILAACTQTRAILEAGSVFWISGLAGTGKTAIAVTVAEWSDKRNLLAANFFCSHSDAECSDPNLIFPTFSRQLCSFHPPFKDKVAAILRDKPDLVHASPMRQFEELIVLPLEAVKDTFPRSVIVLDALDECVDEEATSIILTAIARFIPRIAGLVLFVVTSRPERRITVMFEKAAADTLKDVTTPLLLHKIELASVLNDIRRYLEDGLAQRSPFFTVAEGWPTTQDVNRLAEMSGGLFIWAATALRFIMDRSFCDPEGQLQSLLAPSPASRPRETILDSLYTQIANAAFAKVASTLSERLRSILGTIILAQEPLPVGTLVDLVGFTEGVVRNALIGLGSVLHVPDSANPMEAIHIIHLTFPEFLLASSPDKPEAFCIAAPDRHLAMFARCMVIMRGLKRNIAGIKSPSAFKSEIPGLEKTIKECISPPLGYACRYWSTHLVLCVESAQADSSYDVFSEFLHCYYLYWLEACSLIGIIDGVVNAHYAVLQACRTLGGRFAGLTPFLVDCRRFALTYAACVDMAPLQLYYSALAVAPTKSLVKKAYTQDLGASLMVRHGVRSEWAPCLDSFKGHGSRVALAVAFSTSGDYFITGGQDTKLRMWRPTTRTMILSFDGHTNPVLCVAFSPDGTHVASGSSDRDVRVWQVSSGECVQTLKGHTGFVYSVAYSADGLRILSAAKMGEVKLWDPSDGRCILTLDKTIIDTAQAGISPDGGVIARGDGSSLVLYDVSSATKEVFEFPALVQAATFSPDGRYVAARSDHVIRVWRFADRSLVRSIDVSGNRLSSQLAFSRDGAHIGCGLENGSVYLWHVASEAPPRVLCGHTRWVYNLSWSPNGLEVISVSSDGTVRVWDITQPSTDAEDVASLYRPTTIGPVRFVLARHTRAVLLLHLPSLKIDAADCSAFPCALPEGAPVLTPLMDMVDVWDAVPRVNGLSELTRTHPWTAISGRQHVNFAGISIFSPEVPVEISSDGSLVAYPSSTPRNYVVDICDLRTGKVLTSLAGHTDHVRSISFSPDGTLIATGSSDNSVKVWDCANGVMLHSHDQHAGRVEALVFSSDGHLVASASDDETVHVFEATTGRVVQVLESHRAQVMKVAFTTKNTRILSLDNVHWLYIWDVATGTHIYDISLEDDSWIYSLHFSPDGTGVLIPGEHPPEPLAQSLRKPCDRTWPVYAVSREGWLYEKGPGFTARLCWLPSEWRTIFPLGNGQLCTPHRAVVLDVSQLPDYVQM